MHKRLIIQQYQLSNVSAKKIIRSLQSYSTNENSSANDELKFLSLFHLVWHYTNSKLLLSLCHYIVLFLKDVLLSKKAKAKWKCKQIFATPKEEEEAIYA